MPEIDNISHANTRPMDPNGAVHVHQVKITQTKRYDVMIAYGGHGGAEMLKAAEFKRKRLLEKAPESVIPTPKIFRSQQEFKDIWTSIFNDLQLRNKSGMYTYELHEIHIFAHSDPDQIRIRDGEHINKTVIQSLEKLRWSPELGHLVLHSCRSGRFENDRLTERNSEECIARDFSRCQSAYVIGQMVYASFNYGPQPQDWKYRATVNDKIAIDVLGMNELVLWGYKSGDAIKDRFSNDVEYKTLFGGQLWPCRKYRNGEKIDRKVAQDQFNDDDLNFI
ncbi:hypothetical protein [Citrobacter sp. MNAZ 1397]|uniref:hypothetical protein n=1 Tax=Citrobacter sp. MNAZ 1397 TaxID=2911205 RepID=UPI002026C39B|nr:hypothetical protein [Citrobacter sp. MNAZ 1397]MCL9674339.1 hypothetical protein [Citrobacter sp. MNAZ 1397]